MRRQILIFLILTILVSCKQSETCDFNSYVKDIKKLKVNFAFRTSIDLVPFLKPSFCDSIYLGSNISAIGVMTRQQDFILLLLLNKTSNNKIYLATFDTLGKLIDKYELEQFNGVINDTLKQWTTYELKSPDLLLRTDTCELPMYTEKGEKWIVKTLVTDSIIFSNDQITKKPHH